MLLLLLIGIWDTANEGALSIPATDSYTLYNHLDFMPYLVGRDISHNVTAFGLFPAVYGKHLITPEESLYPSGKCRPHAFLAAVGDAHSRDGGDESLEGLIHRSLDARFPVELLL